MKYFFKDNSYSMFKMFVNQLGMTIFGLTLSFPTSGNDTLFMLVSIFAICFYMVLLYFMTWDIGNEERLRIEGNRMKFVKLKGLYLSLGANIINFVLAILILIGYYGASSVVNSAPASPEWAVNLYGVSKLIAGLLEGMYCGIIGKFGRIPWTYLLMIIPSLITCTVAYIAGVKGFRVFPPSKNENSIE